MKKYQECSYITEIYLDARITGTITPFVKGCMYTANMDGYPDEGGELEDLAVLVEDVDGSVHDLYDKLPDSVIESISNECYNEIDEDFQGQLDFETQISIPVQVDAIVDGPDNVKHRTTMRTVFDDSEPNIQFKHLAVLTKLGNGIVCDISNDLPLSIIDEIELYCLDEIYPMEDGHEKFHP